MKYTLLGTTSALAFISLVALMPSASMATTTGGYLPDMTPEQIREAIKNTAPFDMEKARKEAYDSIVKSYEDDYQRELKSWEQDQKLNAGAYAADPSKNTWPKPERKNVSEEVLRGRAESLAMEWRQSYSNQLAAAGTLASNKENETRQQAQQDAQARLAAEREAAIARVTASATGMGMNAGQVKTYVDMVRSEINDQENEARGLGRAVTYPYSTAKTMAALEQVRPAMAQQTQQYDRQMAELAKNGVTSTWSRGALSDGQTLNLDYGYSVKSDGYVYDASGNKAARVDLGAGLVYDLGGRQITGGTQRQFFDELLRGNGTVVGTGTGAQAAATSGSSASSGGSSSASSSSSASTSGVAASGATASSRPSGFHRSAESTTINYADNNSDLTEEVKKLKLPTNVRLPKPKDGEFFTIGGTGYKVDAKGKFFDPYGKQVAKYDFNSGSFKTVEGTAFLAGEDRYFSSLYGTVIDAQNQKSERNDKVSSYSAIVNKVKVSTDVMNKARDLFVVGKKPTSFDADDAFELIRDDYLRQLKGQLASLTGNQRSELLEAIDIAARKQANSLVTYYTRMSDPAERDKVNQAAADAFAKNLAPNAPLPEGMTREEYNAYLYKKYQGCQQGLNSEECAKLGWDNPQFKPGEVRDETKPDPVVSTKYSGVTCTEGGAVSYTIEQRTESGKVIKGNGVAMSADSIGVKNPCSSN